MKRKLTVFFLALFYRLYSWTFRYKFSFRNPQDEKGLLSDLEQKEASPNNHIFAFFHQDELALLPFFSHRHIYAMVSPSRDGLLMASVLEKFGYRVVRGSSNKRPVAAFLEALKKVQQGYKLTFAVDGPRGPIYVVKEGICRLSQKASRPIAPIIATPHRAIRFKKSWNQALLPLPFSTIEIICGPIRQYETQELQKQLLSLKAIESIN